MRRISLLALALASCTPGAGELVPPDATMGDGGRFASAGSMDPSWRATQICPSGATTPGIDVSYWQGTIDWTQVATDVDFAFIRVSDGLNYQDTQFPRNWSEAQANGVIRGAYQFFRPSLDPVAQADLLLSTMGPLQPGDLPPVIDVETSDGMSNAVVIAGVQDWIDRVEGELGVKPIIYTSWGLWSSLTGDTAQFASYPLWVANWGVACPSVPSAWSSWAFWQDTDSGSVPGIAGNVDENWFDGDLAALEAFAEVEPVCGDGVCSGDEDSTTCPEDCPVCDVVPAEGRIIEETEVCFEAGGTAAYWYELDAGSGGSLLYTHATDSAVVDNYGVWSFELEAAGDYLLEAYTAAPHAESTLAAYEVTHAGGAEFVLVDQTAVDGWSELGVFTFDAGAASVRLDDNTGEPWDNGATQIVFDAIRVTPAAEDPGTTPGGTTEEPPVGTTGPGTLADDEPRIVEPHELRRGCGCESSAPATAPLWSISRRR